MRPLSPWKRRLVTAIRWSLLVDAVVFASAGLLTVFPWPVWTQAMGTEAWPVGFVVPEIALWLVPLPVCFAAAALWLGRRGDRRGGWLTGITVVLCAAAVILLCKPAVQAWHLGGRWTVRWTRRSGYRQCRRRARRSRWRPPLCRATPHLSPSRRWNMPTG